jgi:hypothetical protein
MDRDLAPNNDHVSAMVKLSVPCRLVPSTLVGGRETGFSARIDRQTLGIDDPIPSGYVCFEYGIALVPSHHRVDGAERRWVFPQEHGIPCCSVPVRR